VAYPDIPLWLELARLGRDFAWSGARSLLPQQTPATNDRYCLFMGAPRNGHSLVGSMLDAHRNVVMAHELGVPKYLLAHFSVRQLQLLLIANARRHAASGRRHIHYSHAIRGQWQGRYEDLRVIGDKHGEGFLLSVRARPWLAHALIERLDPLYLIHVIRNPFDAIASVAGTGKRNKSPEQVIGYFDRLYETLTRVQEQLPPGRLHEVRFEDLQSHPREQLGMVCRFLDVDPTADYLDACASIVLRELPDRRNQVHWDDSSRQRVEALIRKYPFLSGYAYED